MSYAGIYEIDDFEAFSYLIQHMDSEFLKYHAKLEKDKSDSK